MPTINVSLVDLSFIASRETSVDEINEVVKVASDGALKEFLITTMAHLYQLTLTTIMLHLPTMQLRLSSEGTLVKVCSCMTMNGDFKSNARYNNCVSQRRLI